MSFIVWDGSYCVTFNSTQANKAWDYVQNHRSMSENFDGWIDSVTANNHVAVINQFDTRLPYKNAPRYMQPKESTNE